MVTDLAFAGRQKRVTNADARWRWALLTLCAVAAIWVTTSTVDVSGLGGRPWWGYWVPLALMLDGTVYTEPSGLPFVCCAGCIDCASGVIGGVPPLYYMKQRSGRLRKSHCFHFFPRFARLTRHRSVTCGCLKKCGIVTGRIYLVTITNPCIEGCTLQKYGYLPGFLKRCFQVVLFKKGDK
jgi:hypothetical protein